MRQALRTIAFVVATTGFVTGMSTGGTADDGQASSSDVFAEAMSQGEAALNGRRFLTALTAFTRANEARGKASPEAWLGMSRASYGMKVFPESLKSADLALKHVGRNTTLEAAVRHQRALALAGSAEYPGEARLDEAEREFAAAAKLDPALSRPSFERGAAHLLAYRETEGVKELTQFVSNGGASAAVDAARRLIAAPWEVRQRFAAPTFSLTTSSGQVLSSANLRGQVVVLDFWGTWCPPCRAATPGLIELNRKYSGQITMIGIGAREESQKVWSDYIAEHKMAWPQYLDSIRSYSGGPPDEGPVSRTFNVSGYPTYIVIDREGAIRSRSHDGPRGKDALEDAIKRAIAVPAARRPS
jgi:thiol-disulfide isomerase/thioredoxin